MPCLIRSIKVKFWEPNSLPQSFEISENRSETEHQFVSSGCVDVPFRLEIEFYKVWCTDVVIIDDKVRFDTRGKKRKFAVTVNMDGLRAEKMLHSFSQSLFDEYTALLQSTVNKQQLI